MDLLKRTLREKLIIATIVSVSAGIGSGLIIKHHSTKPWTERQLVYLKFPGELFLRLVNSLILPLITSSIVSATYNLKTSGPIGIMALYYYTTTTTLGIMLSVILVQTIKPGELLKNENVVAETTTRYYMTVDTILDLLRNLFPDNIVNACLSQYQTVLERPENDTGNENVRIPLFPPVFRIGNVLNLPVVNVLALWGAIRPLSLVLQFEWRLRVDIKIYSACFLLLNFKSPATGVNLPLDEWKISHQDIPGTNVLGLVFYSLLLGIAIGNMNGKGKPLLDFFHCLSESIMKIMNWVIMAAPISVLFLICGKMVEVEDFTSIIQRLGIYILTVLAGLLIQGYVLLPLLYFITTRNSPYKVILHLGPALATACGTSSSTATVPVTIRCLERIGIDPKVIRFVVPIGATINMDGIALYETIGAIFIIQLRGLDFSLFRIIVISITCTVSCIGAAGLPNGGYVMLIMVLISVGVPVEDVSLIIAIDWFVDRFRTTINIIADGLGAGIISHYYKKNEKLMRPIEETIPLNV